MSQKRFTIGREFDMEESPGKQKELKNGHSNFLLAKYVNIGYYLVAPLFLGVFFGLVLDRVFKTKPVFTMSGIVLGTAGVFYNLYKTIKET